MTRRCRLVIRGRVQGVGFRWFVRELGRSLDLSGHVWNRADGAVELEAEGQGQAIDELVARVRIGPSGASVEGVEELATAGTEGILPKPFAVKR